MVVKKIKFSYYNIYLSQNGEKTTLDWEKFLNGFPSLNTGKNGDEVGNTNGKYRNIRFKNGIIRLDYLSDKDGLLYMNFVRLSENGASKSQRKESGIEKLDLDEDEYVSYDVSAIFDKANGIMMIQNNKFAMTAKKFQEYVNIFWGYNSLNTGKSSICIDEIPADEVDLDKVKSFKKFHFAVKDINTKNSNNSFMRIFNAFNKYKGYTIDVTISKDRKGKKYLNEDAIREDIQDIAELSKAELVYLDDDTEKTEILDLLDANKSILLSFDIKPKETLERSNIESTMRTQMGLYMGSNNPR